MAFTINEILLIICPFLLLIVGTIAKRNYLVILAGMLLTVLGVAMTWPLWTKILIVLLGIGIVFGGIFGGKKK